MTKNTELIRVTPETKNKIDSLKRELSVIENKDIKTSEIMKRTFNIPNLEQVLKVDAENKRRFRS